MCEMWEDGAWEPHIVCPHCSSRDVDNEELRFVDGLNYDGDKARITCGKCGEEFDVTVCVEYSFQTNPCSKP